MLAAGALSLGVLAPAACAMEAGDYVVYRVAFAEQSFSASCFEDAASQASTTEDSSSIYGAATLILYISDDGLPRLDTGDMVLSGEQVGDDFTFDGKSVDVEVGTGDYYIDSDHDGLDDNGADDFVDSDGDGVEDYYDEDVDVDHDGLHDLYDDDMVDANNDGRDDRIVEVLRDARYKTSMKVEIEMTVDGDTVVGSAQTITSTSCSGSECPTNYGSSCTVSADFEGVEIDDADVSVDPGGSGI